MKFTKLLLASSISAALLSACGGDDNKKDPAPKPAECTGVNEETRTLEGNINCDVTLDASAPWTLKGVVNVGNGQIEIKSDAELQAVKDNGATLTIAPGTEIKADADGALIITRGAKIMAEGTKADPITFSSLDDDLEGSGEWGGIVIQGFAPHHATGTNQLCSDEGFCNVQGEGGNDDVAFFGGEDEADDSGSLKYVRIVEAGKVAGPDNEINGLTLQGVGHGTDLSYIQVHGNLDDGIEWFGGTANLKYAVLTNNDDDDLDFDEGYQGHIQHVLVIKDQNKAYPTGKNDPRGIEANSGPKDGASQSVKATNAKLANITIIGSDLVNNTNDLLDDDGNPIVFDGDNKDLRKQSGMRLRGDLTVSLANSLVVNYQNCIRVDNGAEGLTSVTVNNVITGLCNDKKVKFSGNGLNNGIDDANENNLTPENLIHLDDADITPTFSDALALTDENATLETAYDMEELEGRVDFTFDNTDYIGAVQPGTTAEDAWWAGWTIPGSTDLKAELKAQAD